MTMRIPDGCKRPYRQMRAAEHRQYEAQEYGISCRSNCRQHNPGPERRACQAKCYRYRIRYERAGDEADVALRRLRRCVEEHGQTMAALRRKIQRGR